MIREFKCYFASISFHSTCSGSLGGGGGRNEFLYFLEGDFHWRDDAWKEKGSIQKE